MKIKTILSQYFLEILSMFGLFLKEVCPLERYEVGV